MERRIEAIVSNPLWLVLIVAVAIGLPVIALGEIAGTDARSRLRAAETSAAVLSADRAAAVISDQLRGARDQVIAATQPPITGKLPPLAAALQAGDSAELTQQLDSMRSALAPGLPGATLGDIAVLDAKNVVVVTSAGARGVSTDPSHDRSDRPYVGIVSAATPIAFAPIFRISGSSVSETAGQPWFAIAARLADPVTKEAFGTLVVVMNPTRFGQNLRSQVPTVDETYLVDERGRLVVRASRPFTIDANFLQDLSAEPTIKAALAGTIASEQVADPFGRGPRLASSARVTTVNWRLINMSLPTVASVELDAALQQQRFVRVGLIAILLAASYLLAGSVRHTMRQRRELATANVRIAQANEAKSRFLASMSHELRTPLNAIIGFADVLGQRMFGELNEKQAEYVKDIVGSGRHLLTLINDILDLSKVESGRMTLEPATFSLREGLASGVTIVRDRAAAHRIALALDVAPDVDLITADERKVRQVLFNLLSNAVKFTPDGGRITVSAARDDREVRIAVADTGPGIALEDQSRIFDEFTQTQDGRRSDEGTGLGLTLAKRLVELHGGRLWVDSQVGKGTTFTFSLPLLVERVAS